MQQEPLRRQLRMKATDYGEGGRSKFAWLQRLQLEVYFASLIRQIKSQVTGASGRTPS
jgi:hypothetical protein